MLRHVLDLLSKKVNVICIHAIIHEVFIMKILPICKAILVVSITAHIDNLVYATPAANNNYSNGQYICLDDRHNYSKYKNAGSRIIIVRKGGLQSEEELTKTNSSILFALEEQHNTGKDPHKHYVGQHILKSLFGTVKAIDRLGGDTIHLLTRAIDKIHNVSFKTHKTQNIIHSDVAIDHCQSPLNRHIQYVEEMYQDESYHTIGHKKIDM